MHHAPLISELTPKSQGPYFQGDTGLNSWRIDISGLLLIPDIFHSERWSVQVRVTPEYRFLLLPLLFTLFASSGVLFSQSGIYEHVVLLEQRFNESARISPLKALNEERIPAIDSAAQKRNALICEPDPVAMRELLNNRAPTILLEVPVSPTRQLVLQLYRAEIFDPGFILRFSSDLQVSRFHVPGVHYRGVIKGDSTSIAAISIFEDEIYGLISHASGNISIGKLKGNGRLHSICNDRNIPRQFDFSCETVDESNGDMEDRTKDAPGVRDPGDCVKVHVEVDYDIYLSKNDPFEVTAFITAIFNQSFLIYENEYVDLKISEMLIWDTPSPYYPDGEIGHFWEDTSAINGNIKHLVRFDSWGRARSIGGICQPDPNLSKCFSGITAFYGVFPAYSPTVNVITHEMGHLLGSRHTHACVWNGDNTAIDGCAGFTEGDCPLPGIPDDGGTIMSYCYQGFPLTNGFGPQPGNTIRNFVANPNNCLDPCQAGPVHDIGIISILEPSRNICASVIEPVVVLRNFGIDTVYAAMVKYKTAADSLYYAYPWTGLLLPGWTDSVALPELEVQEGSQTITVFSSDPDGAIDQWPRNDTISALFGKGSRPVTFRMAKDWNNSAGIYWNVSDISGQPIMKGGPYLESEGTLIEESFCIPEGCLDLEVFDAHGDGLCCDNGNGYYLLLDDATGDTLVAGGEFAFFQNSWFCAENQEANIRYREFPDSVLTQKGLCSTTTRLDFDSGSPSKHYFQISGLDSKLNTSLLNRYTDLVTIAYQVIGEDLVIAGPYSGGELSSVRIELPPYTRYVSVTLENEWQNEQEVSVSLGPIVSCSTEPHCPDSDGDWICDADDICYSGDDQDDFDADGIPDACDNCPYSQNFDQVDEDADGIGNACDISCAKVDTLFFPVNSLYHGGSSFTETVLDVGENQYSGFNFLITGIGQSQDTSACFRFIESVEVLVDGKRIPTRIGEEPAQISIWYPQPASRLAIRLSDAYDGNVEEGLMSVQVSPVLACREVTSSLDDQVTGGAGVSIFPNPSHSIVTVTLDDPKKKIEEVSLYTPEGRMVPVSISFLKPHSIQLSVEPLPPNLYFLRIGDSGHRQFFRRIMIGH